MTKWNTKCRFFNENYACDTLTSEDLKSCDECKFSSPYSKKILIIKLGALGDVLRTTSILSAIKEKYPDSLIYWLALEESKELLENNPYIDKLLIYSLNSILRIQQEKFDILYSLEINAPATLIANLVRADENYGYYFLNGSTSYFNEGALEYLDTAFLTNAKKKNRKTYQELIFKTCNLPYKKQEIVFNLTEKHKALAEKFKKENQINKEDKIIGINFGSGERWPSKSPSKDRIKEIIRNLPYKIIILGGPEEVDEMKQLEREMKEEGINLIIKNTKESIHEFAALLSLCDKVITTDSLALHISTALKKPTIALFFSTPSWEIEDYAIVKKITSPLLEKHFFSNAYSEELANSISAEEVLKALQD